MNPVIIALMLQGAPAVVKGMASVDKAGQKMGTSLEKNSERGAKGLDNIAKSAKSANSALRTIDQNTAKSAKAAAAAWSPYLDVLKQIEAAEKRLGQTKVSTPRTPSGSGGSTRQPKAPSNPNNPFADNQRPVNKGGASSWNPYIASVQKLKAEERAAREETKRLEAEARKLPNAYASAKSAAVSMWTSFRSGAKASQSDIDDLTGKLKTLDSAVSSVEFNGLQEKASTVRNAGLGIMATGAAVGAVGVKSAMNADEMNMTRKGLSFSLGGDAQADKAIERLQGIDRDSSFDFRETAQLFKGMLGKGFSEADAFKNLTGFGDIVSRTGGNTDNLSAVLRQVGQGKSKGKFEKQDLDVMAEAGGIPIYQLLKENLSPERFQEMMSGSKVLTADEFFSAIDAASPKFAGGMKEGNDSLMGDMSNFNSALFQLGAILGQYVLPPLRFVVQTGTAVADFFRALPAPFQMIIAYGGSLFAVVAVLGGGLLVLVGTLTNAALSTWSFVVAIGAETTAKNLAAGATSRLALANLMSSKMIFGTAIPALVAYGIAIIAIAVIIWGFTTAFKGYADTTTKSAAEVKESWGVMGSLWIQLGDWLTGFMNHKFWKWAGIALDPGNILGLRDNAKQKADADEERAVRETNERRRRRGKRESDWKPGHANDDEYIPLTAEEKRKRDAAKFNSDIPPEFAALAKGGDGGMSPDMAAALKTLQPSAIPTTAGGMPIMPAASSAMPAMPSASGSSGATSSIESLEDQIAASSDKEQKKALREQLRQARRSQKHEHAATRETKSAESDKLKRAREAVYLGAELRADGSVDFQDIGEMVDVSGIEKETAHLLRRKAIHGEPAAKKRQEREAAKAEKLQKRQQLAMQQLQYDQILDDPSSTKEQRKQATLMKRQLSRRAKFESLGLAPPPMTSGGGNSLVTALQNGKSLYDLTSGGTGGSGGGGTTTSGGGSDSTINAQLVSQSPGSKPNKIKVIFEGEIETDSDLAKQLSSVVGGFPKT